jgi:uncharacterized cofD-like protein
VSEPVPPGPYGPPAGPAEGDHGGGHGLAASLSALRRVTDRLTAVVTVADDGGSSGRLREEFGCLPPGDLRMALAALCGDDEWGTLWSRVTQHRFTGDGPLEGHSVGNLLILALWQLLDDPVAGLDVVGRLLGAQGRVLPMAVEPMDIAAQVVEPGERDAREVRGQVAVATAAGRVVSVHLVPEQPLACAEAVGAVREADWVVLGPGSWFTSVLPHLLVPDLRSALVETPARRLVALNLAPEGETTGFSPEQLLDVLAAHVPDLRLDVVLADRSLVDDAPTLADVAASFGAGLVLADLAFADGTPRHDPVRLALAYAEVLGIPAAMAGADSVRRAPATGASPDPRGRISPWR